MVKGLAVCLFAIAAASCGANTSTTPSDSSSSHLLATGSWELRVDRAWGYTPGVVNAPGDTIPDGAYTSGSSSARYLLTRAGDGGIWISSATSGPTTTTFTTPDGHVFTTTIAVSIGASIKGTVVSETADRIIFVLRDGTAAGGRLIVWRSGQALQGELTIYGSGVPIIQSERGSVARPAA